MSTRYVPRAPKRVHLEDEWYPEPRETMEIIITSDEPQDTGLLDQHGTPLMRVVSKAPMGFCR